jgi:hypothetical protein
MYQFLRFHDFIYNQPDMMNIMITYNPILLGLFTASWTAGMAAMMFPATVPMVSLLL